MSWGWSFLVFLSFYDLADVGDLLGVSGFSFFLFWPKLGEFVFSCSWDYFMYLGLVFEIAASFGFLFLWFGSFAGG